MDVAAVEDLAATWLSALTTVANSVRSATFDQVVTHDGEEPGVTVS
jgi:hypothetical protein